MAIKVYQLANGQELDLIKLKEEVEIIFMNKKFAYNQNKTERGMFVKGLLPNPSWSHLTIELALIFGVISNQERKDYYKKGEDEQELIKERLVKPIKILESRIGEYLTKEVGRSGRFFLDWDSTNTIEVDVIPYGICYLEEVKQPLNV